MRVFLTIMLLYVSLLAFPASMKQQQGKRKFDPQKFEAAMEQFISTDAGLTPQESAAFFPLYREMRKKQMAYFADGRRFWHTDVTDEKACEESVIRHAESELRIKEIQKTYHQRFLKVLPASKVLRVIKAESRFHRKMMRRAAKQRVMDSRRNQ